MLQMHSAVAQHQKLFSRALDLVELKGHLIRILNSMTELVHDLPTGDATDPDTTFLIAGWSWKKNSFCSWLLHYDSGIKKFTFRPTKNWKGSNHEKFLSMTGDYEEEFKKRLIDLLKKKNKLKGGGFDMEPLEILRDMLRDDSFDLIGGSPQVAKVYKYSNSRPYGVFWPNRSSGCVSIGGRPLLDYELSEYLILDPDTMETTKHAEIFK